MMTDSYPEDDQRPVTVPAPDAGEVDPDFEIEVSGGPMDGGGQVQTNPPPK
jgi:hypothetical protein